MTYFKASESNQSSPFVNGSRIAIDFSSQKKLVFAKKSYLECDLAYPGEMVKAKLTLYLDDAFAIKIYKGLDFDFYHQENLIGTGVVIDL